VQLRVSSQRRAEPFGALKPRQTKKAPDIRGEEKMIKRILLTAAVAISGLIVSVPKADAAVIYRPIAPVRRVAARAVLPPYPVARRAVYGPVYRPYAYPAYGPAFYGGGFYGPGVGITVW